MTPLVMMGVMSHVDHSDTPCHDEGAVSSGP